MYDALSEQMELSELKRLRSLMPGDALSARILNMLWVNFSHDQDSDCVAVTEESVERFNTWLKSGREDDARG